MQIERQNSSTGKAAGGNSAGEARQCWSLPARSSADFAQILRTLRRCRALIVACLLGFVGVALAQSPDAPLIGPAFAGDTQVFVSFSAPVSGGGGPISNYSAACTSSGGGTVSGSGVTAPIAVSGLANGSSYQCTVTATNAGGTSAPSAAVSITPVLNAPLVLIGVKSRKSHGTAGVFDMPINTAESIGGAISVEPRASSAGHSIAFQFNATVNSVGVVTAQDEASALVSATAATVGNEVVVTLPMLANNKRVIISLPTVNGIAVSATASVGFLLGDVNDARAVNQSGLNSTKARAGQTTTATNFRFDANTSGAINAADISAVKARAGATLRPATLPPAGIVARVEIEQKGLMLTQAGAFKQLSAKAFDAQGNPLTATFTWTSGKPAVIAVDATGKATAAGNGSSQIVAVAGGISSPPLLALVTETAPGAILLTDAQIVGEPFETIPTAVPSFSNTYQVRLSGVSPPAIGSILMNTESKVVAGRVVAVDSTGNPIIVTLALLTAREMFPTLDFNETIDMSNAAVNTPPDIVAAYNITRVGNTFTFVPKATPGKSSPLDSMAAKATINAVTSAPQAGPTGTRALPPFTSCEVSVTGAGGEGAPLPIALSAPPLFTVTASPVLDVSFNLLSALLVKRFVITAEPVIKFEGGVSIAAAFEGKIECKAELFAYVVPAGGPLALILGGVVPFGVGFEAGGKITVATMGIGTKVEVKGKIKAGVVCPGGNPPCTFERAMDDFTAKVTPTLDAPSLGDVRVEPSLSAFGYMEASIGNVFLKSLRFDFVKAKAGATLAGSFALKESQIIDPLYVSDYKLSLDVGAGAGGKLGDVLTLLGLPAVSALELKASTDIAKSPAGIATGAVTADKASFVSGETVNFTVKLDPATVDFFPIIGPYNVKKIQLTRKVGGVVTVVASVNAAPAQTTFNLVYTAPDSGSVVQFSAFVVTTLLPLDLLSLEIGPAVSGPELFNPDPGIRDVKVAMDASGNAIAVWWKGNSPGPPSKVFANRYVAGTGWSAVQSFQSNSAQYFPNVAMDASGNAIAIWLEQGSEVNAIPMLWASRFTRMGGWGTAELLGDAPLDIIFFSFPHTLIAMNAGGDAVVTADGLTNRWARKYTPGIGWGPRVELDSVGGQGSHSLSIGADGTAMHVAKVGLSIRAQRFTATTGWSAPAVIAESLADSLVQVASDSDGNAVALWTGNNRNTSMQGETGLFASRYDANSGWGSPVLLMQMPTNGALHISGLTAVFDTNGVATATWVNTNFSETIDIVSLSRQYSRFVPGAGWSSPLKLAPDLPASQASIFQRISEATVAVLGGCTLIASWRQKNIDTLTGINTIWSRKFTPAQGWAAPNVIQATSDLDPGVTPALAASGNGQAIAAWLATVGTQSGLWSQSFQRDSGPPADDCAVTSNVVVTAPITAIAGTSFPVTVEVRDALDQRDTNFIGAVQFTSTDPAAVLPAAYTFTLADAGSHAFDVTLRRAGARLVSAAVGGASGTRTITVNPGAPTQLTFVQSLGVAEVNKLITPSVTVGVSDAFDNVVTSATGSVSLALGNNLNSASLLGLTQSALVNGVATFAGLSINKAGTFSLIATYPGGLTRTSGLFTVTDAPIGD